MPHAKHIRDDCLVDVEGYASFAERAPACDVVHVPNPRCHPTHGARPRGARMAHEEARIWN